MILFWRGHPGLQDKSKISMTSQRLELPTLCCVSLSHPQHPEIQVTIAILLCVHCCTSLFANSQISFPKIITGPELAVQSYSFCSHLPQLNGAWAPRHSSTGCWCGGNWDVLSPPPPSPAECVAKFSGAHLSFSKQSYLVVETAEQAWCLLLLLRVRADRKKRSAQGPVQIQHPVD